jgi:DNA helicase-2/ATP-dependent DNA helicase PcrA
MDSSFAWTMLGTEEEQGPRHRNMDSRAYLRDLNAVAMTRARQHLHLVQPMRIFRSHQHRHGDGHILAMRSRFIPDAILDRFQRQAHSEAGHRVASATGSPVRVDVAARMREMWD